MRLFLLGVGLVLACGVGLAVGRGVARFTISGGGLKAPVVTTDPAILESFDIFSGPGNFRRENGVSIPMIRDGSILWTAGAVSDVPRDLPLYEVSFWGASDDQPPLYLLQYRHDTSRRTGYLYLPGKGEKGYTDNVRTIARGVEGNWFRASDEFFKTVDALLLNAGVSRSRQAAP